MPHEDLSLMTALRSALTVTGMFKSSSSNRYGCDASTCTLRTGAVVSTLPLASAIVYLDLAYRSPSVCLLLC